MGKFFGKNIFSRATSTSSVAVLFPAYIYPAGWTTPGAWDPLYNAIKSTPSVTFQVIINPNSGPGGSAPNSDYAQAISKLKTFSNAVLLGYVHTSYGSRSADAVSADIDQYKSWSSQNLAMNGIFFDEAPSSASDPLYNYMKNITSYARTALRTRTNLPLVYFNPGTVPDVKYYDIADRIVVFEDTYANFLKQQQSFQTGTSLNMKKSSFLIHSVNTGLNQTQYNTLVSSLYNNGSLSSLYLTTVTDQSNPYGAFGSDWTTFVAAVDNLRNSS